MIESKPDICEDPSTCPRAHAGELACGVGDNWNHHYECCCPDCLALAYSLMSAAAPSPLEVPLDTCTK